MDFFDEGEKLGMLIVTILIAIPLTIVTIKIISNFNPDEVNTQQPLYTNEILLGQSTLYTYNRTITDVNCSATHDILVNDLMVMDYLRTTGKYFSHVWYCHNHTLDIYAESQKEVKLSVRFDDKTIVI